MYNQISVYFKNHLCQRHRKAGVSVFSQLRHIMHKQLMLPIPPPAGKKLIFRPWITCRKTGIRIYPKNGRVFPLWVDAA
jgi:hypothetical protein